jgi:2-dehydropantoate 2-reductase
MSRFLQRIQNALAASFSLGAGGRYKVFSSSTPNFLDCHKFSGYGRPMINQMKNHPRIAIVGPGGVGGYLGGRLAHSGLDVTFVARSEHAEVLSTKGLILKTVDDEIRLPKVHAVDSASKLGQVDVVLLTTKSYDLRRSLENLSADVKQKAMFVTFQNGIDNDQAVREDYPHAEVYPGVAYIISAKKEPGVFEQSAGPRKFLVGDRHSTDNAKLQDFAVVMRDAGIDCQYSPCIEKDLWKKFIWILAFSGVTASRNSAIGPIVNSDEGLAEFTRCVDEGIAVAQALQVDIGDQERNEVLAKADGYKTKGTHARASLAIDLTEGRPTEVEAIHGALVRLSDSVSIPVPTIKQMYHAIKQAEAAR